MIDFYSRNSKRFAEKYEKVSPDEINSDWHHIIPSTKTLILDVGTASGRDAAWLAEKGHEVIAVEPADGLRKIANELHPNPSIQWIKETLPAMKKIYELNLKFDLILVNAVWMHVAPGSRERAFRKLVNLLKPGGLLVITLRNGPSPSVTVLTASLAPIMARPYTIITSWRQNWLLPMDLPSL